MKYTYIIGFHGSEKTEEVDSNYLPEFKEDNRTGEIFLVIYGKECGMYYWPCEAYIKCIYERV